MRLPICFALIVALTLGLVCSALHPSDAAGSESTQDLHIKQFLQKRFHIADLKDINLGMPTPSPFPGLFHRTLTVTTPRGPLKADLFTNASGDKVIIGQYLDIHSDPWGRIDTEKLRLTDRATLGPDDAPVTIVEFADFECPFCARAFTEIEPLVENRYKGKVRLIFKNFPLSMHPWARPAAIAAECIRRQNPADFWEFAQIIYTSQAQIDSSNLRSRVDAYAKAAKLDSAALNACMMGKSADEVVNQDQRDGMIAHVQSTPTFLINGIPVAGLPEEKSFEFVIKSQLKDAQRARQSSAG
ncbi:MAG TPA: thioredoxin domain-containing protein [Candidatus Binataceae bacterium]|nr:thioredoxin domain-containing protein [Candidatus Binataceae bacterium]